MKPGALAHMISTSEQLNALEQRISRLAVALRHLRQQSETDEAAALHQALRRRDLLLKSEIHEHTLVPRPRATQEEFFIANSDPDLVGNLGTCLAHHFRPAPLPFSEDA